MEWIKCEPGKMPEDFDTKNRKVINVLVTTNTSKVTKVQRLQDIDRKWYWGRILGGMRAWMPLPEPYKE